jgi:hypothetical protein
MPSNACLTLCSHSLLNMKIHLEGQNGYWKGKFFRNKASWFYNMLTKKVVCIITMVDPGALIWTMNRRNIREYADKAYSLMFLLRLRRNNFLTSWHPLMLSLGQLSYHRFCPVHSRRNNVNSSNIASRRREI